MTLFCDFGKYVDRCADVLGCLKGNRTERVKREDSATTLEIGKRHFGGVPILTAQTETTTYGRRGPKVSHSKKNYAWIADSQSFTACDKLIGNAHSSSCGRRCQSGGRVLFRPVPKVRHRAALRSLWNVLSRRSALL